MSNTEFNQLRRNRENDFKKVAKTIEQLSSQKQNSNEDNRFWQPQVDKAGNGFAVIRFLPAPSGEDAPFVRMFSHAFQGPGGWLIDNCLTTINQKCPVCEENSKLWNSGIDSNKKIAQVRKRKLNFVSNIYVVKDSANPSNEGKVFLFKYGKRIYDKLHNAMYPEFEDEKPLNPFDLWDGADFKLKIRAVEGYRNYDKSEFDQPGALSSDDSVLENIWKQEHSLGEFVDIKKFKSYEDLSKRLAKALGAASSSNAKASELDEEDMDSVENVVPYKPKAKTAKAKDLPEEDSPWSESSSDDTEDELPSFFKKLAED